MSVLRSFKQSSVSSSNSSGSTVRLISTRRSWTFNFARLPGSCVYARPNAWYDSCLSVGSDCDVAAFWPESMFVSIFLVTSLTNWRNCSSSRVPEELLSSFASTDSAIRCVTLAPKHRNACTRSAASISDRSLECFRKAARYNSSVLCISRSNRLVRSDDTTWVKRCPAVFSFRAAPSSSDISAKSTPNS